MPNWCDVTYKCVGDPKEVKSLYKVLQYINNRKTSILKNGFSKFWLGNLVHKLGYDWKEYRCRGEITDFYLDSDNVLTIAQNTAWCEQEGVRDAIEKAFPSIKVYYIEEEPGCDVYDTNDSSGKYFPERFYLDSYDQQEYFKTIEEAADYVAKIIGHKVEASVDAIDEALDDYVDKQDNEDVFYCFHEFTVIDS